MNSVFVFLRTIVTYFLVILLAVVCVPVCLLIACLPVSYRYNNHLFFYVTDFFFKSLIRLLFIPIEIVGIDNIPKDVPLIFVANHQSALDIPVVGALCNGYPQVWLVLEYYIHKPLLGFLIRRMFISVDPANPAKAARSLIQLVRFVKNRQRHIIIFPEGGRFIDGKVHNFFEGFAIIAKKTAYPVVPVFMQNNGKIYPPHSFLIHPYPLKVVIGKPLGYLPEDTDSIFTRKVHTWFNDIVQEK